MNARNPAIILYAKKNMTSVSVGKGAYGMINVLCEFFCGFFKFNGCTFTLLDK